MDRQLIINDFKRVITKLYGERLYKIILYGSYARGDYNEESDIDFLVVLKDENISVFKEISNIVNVIYDYILKYNINISSLPTTQKKFLSSTMQFYKEVRKDGIEV
jgi:predicted nucleotidyltransferase